MEFNISELLKLGGVLGGLIAHYFIIRGDIAIITERQRVMGELVRNLSILVEQYKESHTKCSSITAEKLHNLEKDTDDIVKKLYDLTNK